MKTYFKVEFRVLGRDGKLYLLVYVNCPRKCIYKACIMREVFDVVQNVTV